VSDGPAPALTHIALHVADVEAVAAFYQRFCHLDTVHERAAGDDRVVWLARPGEEKTFILVLIPGGEYRKQPDNDYGHLGFALGSRTAVDAVAEAGRAEGCLAWPPRQDDYPAGYYCGLRDPNGTVVEFSYGQPLGPGAEGTG